MTHSVSVKYVGPTLVAVFNKASPPLIWKFDLEQNPSFTLALQGSEDKWELGVTSFKGEFDSIAHFTSQEDAKIAFNHVQKKLMKGRSSFWGRVLRVILIVIALLVLLSLGLSLFGGMLLRHLATAGLPDAPVHVEMENGIPLPADEVLKPPH